MVVKGPAAAPATDPGRRGESFVTVTRVLLTIVLIVAVGAPSSSNLLWGLNQWALLPLWASATALALALAATWWPARTAAGSRFPAGPFLLALALAFAILWLVAPARSVIFGDNSLVVELIDTGQQATPRSPVYDLVSDRLVRGVAAGGDRLRPLQLFSTGCGWLFLALLALLWGGPLGRPGAAATLVLLGGYLVVFQGYVEAYSSFLAALVAWLIALLSKPSRQRTIALVVTQLVVIATYSIAFLFVPITFWAILPRSAPRMKIFLGAAAAGVAALVALIFLVPRGTGALAYLDPVRSLEHFNQMVGIASRAPWRPPLSRMLWEQPLNAINSLFLSMPLVLVAALALALSSDGRPALVRAIRTPLGVLAVALLVLRLFLVTPLGPLLDWDIDASLSFPFAILVVTALSAKEIARSVERLAPAFLVAGLVLFLPFEAVIMNPARARARLTAYVQGRPHPPAYAASHVQHRIGHLLAAAGDRVGAAEAFGAAWQIYPDASIAQREGINWLMAGKSDRALDAFNRALGLDPDDWKTRLQRANVLFRMDRDPAAEADYRDVVEQQPDCGHALVALGLIAERRDDPAEGRRWMEQAIPALQKVASQYAGNDVWQQDLVQALVGAGHCQEAEPLLLKRTASGNQGLDWYLLGRCRESSGDRSGAADAYRRALAAHPAWMPAREALAKVTGETSGQGGE